jgi:hypothetical protein
MAAAIGLIDPESTAIEIPISAHGHPECPDSDALILIAFQRTARALRRVSAQLSTALA